MIRIEDQEDGWAKEQLLEEFPVLFSETDVDRVWVPNGWIIRARDLCKLLTDTDHRIEYMKEKFGAGRVGLLHFEKTLHSARLACDEFENLCGSTCQRCGEDAVTQSHGSLFITLCDGCNNRHHAGRVILGLDRWHVAHSDALTYLRSLESNSVDSLVTDPPAGIGFMGRDWDKNMGDRSKWICWLQQIMQEVLRVLKPGAHGLVWALPRTSHWTGTALENAGFEIRDCIHHAFGSGFPKSLNVSKALDKAAGATRKVIGTMTLSGTAAMSLEEKGGTYSSGIASNGHKKTIELTAAESDAAKQWDGWGTALKPAHEDWWLVRKPLESTVAGNLVEHGTGALNIDGCRISSTEENPSIARRKSVPSGTGESAAETEARGQVNYRGAPEVYAAPHAGEELGRWPSNLIFSHSEECECLGTVDIKANPTWDTPNRDTEPSTFTGETVSQVKYGDETESVPLWVCADDCPVQALEAQSKNVSRFFYCPKPSRRERDAGLDLFRHRSGGEATGREEGSAGTQSPRAGAGRGKGAKNVHPTSKSIALMSYLVRLVTPPGGVVLDPFTGGGTTGIAAFREGFRFLGCELNDTDEEPFVSIARARISYAEGKPFTPRESLCAEEQPGTRRMF